MATNTAPELRSRAASADVPASIGSYGLIGNCRTAALVSDAGSLDWLCLPRFDSPSVFAALLDDEHGGRFRVRPVGPFQSARRYLPGTNVLETTFTTPGGTCVLRDLMAVSSEEAKRVTLVPDHEILREVEGLTGTVELDVTYEPRPDYACGLPRLEDHRALGIWCPVAEGLLVLRSDFALRVADDALAARGRGRVRAGERLALSLAYCETAPSVIPPLGETVRQKVAQSIYWWRGWSDRCAYDGSHREAVVRSALALKLLAFAPSGAVVAAPTTSLPEHLGGVRNWDYRYCWLRDASLTVHALANLGYLDEADAFVSWMLHATRLTWPELQILYNVFGEARLPERELSHLAGYAGSRPVRVGNDAYGQLQLDIYGEVVDAVAQIAQTGVRLDAEAAHLLRGLGEVVCRRWCEPDEGIWEGRSGRFQHTHSKVLCWIALDRLIELHRAGLLEVPLDRFAAQRDAIKETIEQRGFNARLGSYTRTLDGDEVDASLLLLPIYGYVAASHPRMVGTYRRIREALGRGPLLYRYLPATDDGLPPGEGAFGICSFWGVEYLARAGRLDEAQTIFNQLLGYATNLGLFAEELDPTPGIQLGNFPQAFTHVGLINAALALGVPAAEAPLTLQPIEPGMEVRL